MDLPAPHGGFPNARIVRRVGRGAFHLLDGTEFPHPHGQSSSLNFSFSVCANQDVIDVLGLERRKQGAYDIGVHWARSTTERCSTQRGSEAIWALPTNLTHFSYDGSVYFAVNLDPDAVSDPEEGPVRAWWTPTSSQQFQWVGVP